MDLRNRARSMMERNRKKPAVAAKSRLLSCDGPSTINGENRTPSSASSRKNNGKSHTASKWILSTAFGNWGDASGIPPEVPADGWCEDPYANEGGELLRWFENGFGRTIPGEWNGRISCCACKRLRGGRFDL
jgi:hypothetical protein